MESLLLQEIVTAKGVIIHNDTRRALLDVLWQSGAGQVPTVETHELRTFFDVFSKQCQRFLSHKGQFVAVRTYQDVVDVIIDLRGDLCRQELRLSLLKRLRLREDDPSLGVDDAILDRTVDLAARLFLMLNLGEVPHSISNAKPLEWNNGTIKQFLRQRFEIAPILSYSGVKLPKFFNARNIERIGGITLAWTTNLADHLRMIDDDEKLAIFCYHSFLMLHRTSDIFPEGFIDETLRTLKLLFPSNDDGLKKWALSLPPEVDRKIAASGSLRTELRHIESFKYWRDRLVILKEVFDEAEPKSLSQWWHGRQKRVQWYNFWLAVLVLILGTTFAIIQCIQGTLQVYKSFNP